MAFNESIRGLPSGYALSSAFISHSLLLLGRRGETESKSILFFSRWYSDFIYAGFEMINNVTSGAKYGIPSSYNIALSSSLVMPLSLSQIKLPFCRLLNMISIKSKLSCSWFKMSHLNILFAPGSGSIPKSELAGLTAQTANSRGIFSSSVFSIGRK